MDQYLTNQGKKKSNIMTTVIAYAIVIAIVGGIVFLVGRKMGFFGGNKLRGTYREEYGTGSVTFIDDERMTLNTLGIINMNGTYELNDAGDKMTFHYTIPLIGRNDVTYDFKRDGDTIYLGKTAYYKE